MPHDPYQALYIHIPFCVKRCNYCDFTTSAVSRDSRVIDDYVEELCLKIRSLAKDGELASARTLYMGGGTPSHIGMSRLSMLLYTLGLSMRIEPDVEFTMEANPESLSPNMVRDIWALGVNRLSIGVQSFDDDVLRILGRSHNAQDVKSAVRMAQERFDNVSIDLMCGIPGQSLDSFKESLDVAVGLGVNHVSVYPLTIEEHTPFYNMVLSGEITEPDDDLEASMMLLAADVLKSHGYERYEVASYAKPGYQCRHNIAYWTGLPYLGIGKSAASMTQNAERRMRVQDGIVLDDLTPRQMLAEDLMLGMRMTCGVADNLVSYGRDVLPDLDTTLLRLLSDGLVFHEDGRWKPTEKGWLCGNELYGALFDLGE